MKEKIFHSFEKLQAQKNTFLADLAKLNPSQLNIPEAEGKWSLIQLMDHLYGVEINVLKYVKKKTQDPSACHPATFKTKFTRWSLTVALKSPFKFRAPKGVDKIKSGFSLEQMNREWAQVGADWKTLIEQFPDDLLNKEVFKHPLGGRLRLLDTIEFLSNHFQHHERQTKRLLKKVAPDA